MKITFEPNGPNDQSRILIVDNSSKFTRSARLLLEQTGNYVACAVNDPRRALETARSFKPDLDLSILSCRRRTALKSLRSSKPTGPCTAYRSFS